MEETAYKFTKKKINNKTCSINEIRNISEISETFRTFFDVFLAVMVRFV